MKIKKIIKGIIGIGALGGIAYAAFKLGESNGEVNERLRSKDEKEDGFNYSNMDEPDDECLAPKMGDKS